MLRFSIIIVLQNIFIAHGKSEIEINGHMQFHVPTNIYLQLFFLQPTVFTHFSPTLYIVILF